MNGAVSDVLEQKIYELERRIDSVDKKNDDNKKSLYKNIPILISFMALLFSFGTTYVSYRRTTEQDIQSLRTDLRGLLQRLADLPKENLEALKKYKDDPMAFAMVSGFIAQENNFLSKQSGEIISKIPIDRVSPTDYLAVGIALSNSRYYDNAITFFKKAAESSVGLDDEVASLRNLANMAFVTGRVGDGREIYQDALDIFSKYKGFDPFTVASTNTQTLIYWATSEAATNSLDIANQHLTRAEQIAASLPSGANSELIKSQVSQTRAQIFSAARLPISITKPSLVTTPSPQTP